MYGKVRERREARDVFESSWIYCQRKQIAEKWEVVEFETKNNFVVD